IAWFSPELFGEERLPMLLPSLWTFIPYLLIMILLGGGQEEFGWRGYALPILESKFGIWFANMILGIIHAFWHLLLWFITGTSQTYMNFGGFILLIVGYSYILSWIRKISGNRPFSGLYAHGLANAFIPLVPTLIMQKNVYQPRFWIWVSLTFIIGIIITIIRERKATPLIKIFDR
ncbi:MAG TPA: CPBP family intramembrane glutamic endopeptidase, partial [Ignavibacteriaceae bacterium]